MLTAGFGRKLESRRFYAFVTRLLDLAVSGFSLIIFSPFFLLLILLIRLDSPGKAVFTQQRVGWKGKMFKMYKFRSMHTNVKSQDFAPSRADDPRITRIGKFLRRTSLDELPQFWNVLKGDMSLVGPRPEMKFIVDTYTDIQRARLLVKPGLTGLWQIYGRKDLPLHENVEFDLYYILHRSPWMDFVTILKTFSAVFGGKGAF